MTDKRTETPGVAEYAPFTDSIRADIAALPREVRGVLVDDLFGEYGGPIPPYWPAVGSVALTPVALLLVYLATASRLSDFHRGLFLGLVAMFALDAIGAAATAVERQIAFWRSHRRATADRGRR